MWKVNPLAAHVWQIWIENGTAKVNKQCSKKIKADLVGNCADTAISAHTVFEGKDKKVFSLLARTIEHTPGNEAALRGIL